MRADSCPAIPSAPLRDHLRHIRPSRRANGERRSRRLYEEIFGRGNYAAADELMAPGIINHGPGAPAVPGTDGIKRQAALLHTAIPDLRVTLNDQLGEGDKVASRGTGSGTHAGPLTLPSGTVSATGNLVSFDEIRIDRHAGGPRPGRPPS